MPDHTGAAEPFSIERFSASGVARANALTVLRLITQAVAGGRDPMARALIAGVEPDPAETGKPTRAQVIGVSLGLLDSWHNDATRTATLSGTRIPRWNSRAQTAAADVIGLARKGRAFASITTLHRKHSDVSILEGCVLAITGTLRAWAAHDHQTVRDIGATVFVEPTKD